MKKFILSILINVLQIPCLTNEELKKLGKWYVSTGKEWICHSDYELEEFKNIFLNFISPE